MNWKIVKKFVPIIGILLFIYLLIKLDIKQIAQEITKMNIIYLPIILLAVFIFFNLQTLKWFVLARKQKINISFSEAFKVNNISNFYGFITPGKLGSAIRVNYLKEKGAETGKGLNNFVVDKALDLISLFVLVIFFGMFFYSNLISPYMYCFFLGGLVIIFLLFYNKKTSKFLLNGIYKKLIPAKLKDKCKSLFDTFYNDKPSLSFLTLVLILNIFCWTFNYFIGYLIGLSLGINIGFMPYLIILPIATLVAQIPITINGFGTRELAMINLFNLFGVEQVKIFSMSIIGIVVMSLIPACLALVFISKDNKKIAKSNLSN